MKRPVLPEVLQRLKATLLLTVTALVLSTFVGLALGVASAAWPRSLLDRSARPPRSSAPACPRSGSASCSW
jgi:peptide/nickel transport system permease protein